MSAADDYTQARLTYYWGMALWYFGLLLILYSVVLLGWQCVMWLDKGAWQELPAWLIFVEKSRAALSANPIFELIPTFSWDWLNAPTGLLGAHKIVMWIVETLSVSAVTAFVGVPAIAIGASAQSGQAEMMRIARQKADEDAAKQYRVDHGLD